MSKMIFALLISISTSSAFAEVQERIAKDQLTRYKFEHSKGPVSAADIIKYNKAKRHLGDLPSTNSFDRVHGEYIKLAPRDHGPSTDMSPKEFRQILLDDGFSKADADRYAKALGSLGPQPNESEEDKFLRNEGLAGGDLRERLATRIDALENNRKLAPNEAKPGMRLRIERLKRIQASRGWAAPAVASGAKARSLGVN